MTSFLRNLFAPKRAAKRRPEARRVKPQLECLEQRQVMSVTFHGGAVLPNVAVQGIYYGSDWGTNAANFNQTGALEGFLGNIVNSPYMDMLTNAGYNVGRGHADPGRIVYANPDKTQWLTDSKIQADLLAEINSPGSGFQQPDGNRLYVIFIEPNVAVMNDHYKNQTSQTDFFGYHANFTGRVGNTNQNIRYAVIDNPGGWYNLSVSWLSQFETLTEVTSHEIAEAVTDPDVTSTKTLGWYDDGLNMEVGDITNFQVAYVNGYAVQRIANQGDQPMTPSSATSRDAVSFVLTNNGNVYEKTSSGLNYVWSGVSSISDQGIDNHGRAMIDFITTGGNAYEFHDGSGSTYIWGNAISAKAGQGESFLLFGNGALYEYKDAGGSWSFLANNVTSISAGTDRYGVNAVAATSTIGSWRFRFSEAQEWSDNTGWQFIAYNVGSVSAGRQGIVSFINSAGNAFVWSEWTHSVGATIGANVAQITTGYDPNGNLVIDELFASGYVYEWRADRGWNYLDYNVRSLSKSRGGIVDTNSFADNAWEFDNFGNYVLILGGVKAVA